MVPRPAATVIVAREGVEVLVERRTATSRFAPGFVVFPGGAVGEEDLAAEDPTRECAVRELREETGGELPEGFRGAWRRPEGERAR